jgi:hypothetical protein
VTNNGLTLLPDSICSLPLLRTLIAEGIWEQRTYLSCSSQLQWQLLLFLDSNARNKMNAECSAWVAAAVTHRLHRNICFLYM